MQPPIRQHPNAREQPPRIRQRLPARQHQSAHIVAQHAADHRMAPHRHDALPQPRPQPVRIRIRRDHHRRRPHRPAITPNHASVPAIDRPHRTPRANPHPRLHRRARQPARIRERIDMPAPLIQQSRPIVADDPTAASHAAPSSIRTGAPRACQNAARRSSPATAPSACAPNSKPVRTALHAIPSRSISPNTTSGPRPTASTMRAPILRPVMRQHRRIIVLQIRHHLPERPARGAPRHVLRLQHHHRGPRLRQVQRRRKPGEPRPDHRHVRPAIRGQPPLTLHLRHPGRISPGRRRAIISRPVPHSITTSSRGRADSSSAPLSVISTLSINRTPSRSSWTNKFGSTETTIPARSV